MSFEKLEELFQNHIVAESCWNIPTPIRMSIVSRFDELHQTQLSDTAKMTAMYTTLQQLLEQQPSSELETRQLLSLQQFTNQHPWFNEDVKKAILDDLSTLEVGDAILA